MMSLPLGLLSQSADLQIIASAGGFVDGLDVQVSHTMGETVIGPGSSSDVIINQGFQQPNLVLVGVEELDQNISLSVYPNPANDWVTIEITTPNALNLQISICDIQGKQIGSAAPTVHVGGKHSQNLDVSHLSAGQYVIVLTDGQRPLGTAVIQKVN